jgi:DNA-binding HxlR family transcriptional regulator
MNAPVSGCPINLTLEALGDRWNLIVIRDLMFGSRRYVRELLTRSGERIASNQSSTGRFEVRSVVARS